MTRATDYVSFTHNGEHVIIPSLKEAPSLPMLRGDIEAVIRALVPEPERVLSLPVIEFEEFLSKWADASSKGL